MKCLVVSPSNGTVRIARFAAKDFEVAPVRLPRFEPITQPDACALPECEMVDDLQRRRTAPLELSAGLRARLPSVGFRSSLMAERQN